MDDASSLSLLWFRHRWTQCRSLLICAQVSIGLNGFKRTPCYPCKLAKITHTRPDLLAGCHGLFSPVSVNIIQVKSSADLGSLSNSLIKIGHWLRQYGTGEAYEASIHSRGFMKMCLPVDIIHKLELCSAATERNGQPICFQAVVTYAAMTT